MMYLVFPGLLPAKVRAPASICSFSVTQSFVKPFTDRARTWTVADSSG